MAKQRPWPALIREGRAAALLEGDAKWTLGDLALEVAPIGDDRSNNGGLDRLTKYADEIGESASTLREYRRVAAAWAHDRRLSSVSFSVHQLLASEPEPWTKLAELRTAAKAAGRKRLTVDFAREQLGKRPTRYPAPSPEPASVTERAERVRAELADPEVAEQVADDKETRSNFLAAAGRPKPRAASERRPSYDRIHRLEANIAYAKRQLTGGADELKADVERRGPLDEDDRDDLLAQLDALVGVVEWVRSIVRGDVVDLDAELRDLTS